MTNQLNRGLDLIIQLDSLSVSVNMHEENPRLIPEEVIVQSRDLKAVFKEGGHHRIHFVLSQNQISHHRWVAPASLHLVLRDDLRDDESEKNRETESRQSEGTDLIGERQDHVEARRERPARPSGRRQSPCRGPGLPGGSLASPVAAGPCPPR